jgi:outer membrane lipoprotein carrier protein
VIKAARLLSPVFALVLVLVLVLGLATAAPAQAGGRESFDAFTRGLKGLDGQFSQQVFDSKGQRKESSSGRVALSAPKLFRWEYVKPAPQLIVADGKAVWVYDPDLTQVTTRPQGEEEQNSPLTALTDPAKLERDFILKDAGSREGLSWLEILPKRGEEAGFRNARLGFDAGNALVRMEIVDALGQRTDIRFSGWKRNPTFAADTFRFVTPKGVDVVGAQ